MTNSMGAIHDGPSSAENSTEPLRRFYGDEKLFRRNIFFYIFGASAGAFGFNTAAGMMPMHMAKVHMTPEQISTAMSIRGWIYMVMVVYLSHLTDHLQFRWGRRLPFLAVSLPFLVIGMIVFPYATTPMGCILVFSVFSLFVAVKYDTYSLLTYDLAKQSRWGAVAGVGGFAGGLGVLLGQHFLMPMIDTQGEKPAYFIAAMCLLAATVLTLLFVKEPPIRTAEPPRWNPIPVLWSTLKIGFHRKHNVWLFVGFTLATSTSLVFNYLALQGQVNLHMSQGDVGKNLLQWGTLTSMVLSPAFGLVIDKLGAVKAVLIGYILCVAAALFGYNPHTVHQLLISSILLTVGFNAMYGAGTVFVASGIERKYMAIICGCNGAVSYLIGSVLLMVSGFLIQRVFHGNYGAIYIVAIILSSIGVPMLFWVDRLRKRGGSAEISEEPRIIAMGLTPTFRGDGLASPVPD